MSQIEELRLLAKVAHLYYRQEMSQAEIAQRLSLSQATISRLLKRAEKEGIVRITVSIPPGVFSDLEQSLVERYSLHEAIVVDCERPDDEEAIQRLLGAAAAYYLENTLKREDVIGISSWSATLLAMVDAMRPLPRSIDAQVVQILGGVGQPDAEVHATHLTNRLARLVHGKAVFLPAPGIVGSEEARRVLLADPYVTEAVTLFERLTVALVGIGSVEPSKLLARSGNVFSEAELNLARRQGAVGDVCLRFFDAEGYPVITELDRRVIGIPLEQLRRVERTVGIAGSSRKHVAIRGALRGGWVNVLITDRFTAEMLLNETG